MNDVYGQGEFLVRFDWGLAGARAVRADVTVVVDVFSFSTSVTVAVERGAMVYPYPWASSGDDAERFAAAHDAVLAVGRLEGAKAADDVACPSLSPARLLIGAVPTRLVLPSPNGSTIVTTLQHDGCVVALGCLRNAQAAGTWLLDHLEKGRSVAVVGAGERWNHDNSLRPALEDHLGSGAVLSALLARGYGDRMSPEARSAAELFDGAATQLRSRLHACVGGRELAAAGFAADVDVAGDLDASPVVPVLVDDAFSALPSAGGLQGLRGW